MNEYTFKTNINCGSCIKSVTPFLNELDNLEFWKVDTENPDKILTVQLEDTNVESVLNAISKAGYSIELNSAAN